MSYAQRLAKSVRRFSPEDKERLLEFEREMFGPDARQTRAEYFTWLYEANPTLAESEVPLWILERQGKVVGQQGAMPVPLQIRGRTVHAQWAVDLMVRPEWRMRGVGPALSAAQSDSCDISMALGLSDEAHKAFLSAGWTDMGKLPFLVRPIDVARLLEEKGAPWWLLELTKLAPKRAAGAAAWALSRVLEKVSGTHLEPIEEFDDRVEQLWEDARGDYPVIVHRNLARLKWRFDEGDLEGRYHRYYLMRGDHLLGYVVTRIETWHGMPMGRIVDHFSPIAWTAPLLGEAVEQLHEEGVAAVFYEGLDQRADLALHALGFVHGPTVTRFMFKPHRPLSVPDEWLKDPAHWFVTDGDADRELAQGGQL